VPNTPHVKATANPLIQPARWDENLINMTEFLCPQRADALHGQSGTQKRCDDFKPPDS
jgi:hypothetical protein